MLFPFLFTQFSKDSEQAHPVSKFSVVECVKQVANPQKRIFFFPYLGGGPATFTRWLEAVSETTELWVVCPWDALIQNEELKAPGLIDMIVEALRPLLNCPFIFYGHSLGARIAFETARIIRVATPAIYPRYFLCFFFNLIVIGCLSLVLRQTPL